MPEWEIDHEKYNTFAEKNRHILLVSYPRSGNNWLSSMIRATLDVVGYNLITVKDRELEPGILVHTHLPNNIKFFDGVKYILGLRDPREAFLSCAKFAISHNTAVDNIWENQEYFDHMCNLWKEYFMIELLQKDIKILQYEIMSLYPKRTLQRVVRFVDIEVPSERIDIVVQNDALRDSDYIDPDVLHYNLHCKKWMSEEKLPSWYNDFIYDRLGLLMEQYGYRYDGTFHSDRNLL